MRLRTLEEVDVVADDVTGAVGLIAIFPAKRVPSCDIIVRYELPGAQVAPSFAEIVPDSTLTTRTSTFY